MDATTISLVHDAVVTLYATVIPAAMAVASPWVARELWNFITAAAAKAHLTLSSGQEAQVKYFVEKNIRAAEEIIEAKFKASAIDHADKADAKLATAIEGLVKDVPSLSADQAHVLIHAGLTELGLGAKAGADFLAHKLGA
jgi:type IV secretory pathway TrbF-like protein